MNAFAITLLDAIISYGNELVKSEALVACRNELVGVPTEAAPAASVVVADAPVAAPVALPLVAAAVAPAVVADAPVSLADAPADEDDFIVESDERAIAPKQDARAVAYDALYEEGKGRYLLLDGEDKIEEGDEWIIRPECTTNRARVWREASEFGSEVSEFGRSHYRRRI